MLLGKPWRSVHTSSPATARTQYSQLKLIFGLADFQGTIGPQPQLAYLARASTLSVKLSNSIEMLDTSLKLVGLHGTSKFSLGLARLQKPISLPPRADRLAWDASESQKHQTAV